MLVIDRSRRAYSRGQSSIKDIGCPPNIVAASCESLANLRIRKISVQTIHEADAKSLPYLKHKSAAVVEDCGTKLT